MTRKNVAGQQQTDNRDAGAARRTRLQPRAAHDELDYFRDHKHLPALAACFGVEDVELDKFAVPLVLNRKDWRGVFTESHSTGRLIYLLLKMKTGHVVERRPLDLDILYAMYHGFRQEEMTAVMRFMFRRRLLHDSGLRAVRRTPFRTPHEKFREWLCPKDKFFLWLDHVALLDGLGLAQDLHDDRKAAVPFSETFAPRWCYHALVRQHPDWKRTQVRDVTASDPKRLKEYTKLLRGNLVKAGLMRYEGKGRRTRYKVSPLGENDVGMDQGMLQALFARGS